MVITHFSILNVEWARVELNNRFLVSIRLREQFLIFLLFCFAMPMAEIGGSKIQSFERASSRRIEIFTYSPESPEAPPAAGSFRGLPFGLGGLPDVFTLDWLVIK